MNAKKQPKGKKRSVKDLPVKGTRAKKIKGGKTPSPAGPMPIPYPNTS